MTRTVLLVPRPSQDLMFVATEGNKQEKQEYFMFCFSVSCFDQAC